MKARSMIQALNLNQKVKMGMKFEIWSLSIESHLISFVELSHENLKLIKDKTMLKSQVNILKVEQNTPDQAHKAKITDLIPSLSVSTLSPINVRNSHREESEVKRRSLSSLNGHMTRSPPRTYQNVEHRRGFRSHRFDELGREEREVVGHVGGLQKRKVKGRRM